MRRVLIPVLLLVVAALCHGVVAVERWWPCAVHGMESTACGLRQDDSYDAALRAAGGVPWQTTTLGVGFTLLAVALPVAAVLAGRRQRLGYAVVASVQSAFAAAWAWDAPTTGLGPWLDLLHLVCPVAAFLTVRPMDPPDRPAIMVGVGCLLTMPIVDIVFVAPLLSLGYYSWDANPWSGASTAIGCLVIAVGLGAAARLPQSAAVPPALPTAA